ncbi:LysR family transcriptional regulator [Massilia sp. LXY-6]|uniref:LysR family transcriptional regulator n=1 Tax=Massilia sp. LXY-6 TaxID=3379823 RepID=UPI003EE10A81
MDAKKIEGLWHHLHSLVVVDATGSYTAAAVRLGLTKGAVSQRIAELERASGVALVHRTTRSMQLTEAGKMLVDAVRTSFQDIERSFAGVRDLAETPGGLLRVTAPVALGRQQIVPRMAAFFRAFPQVRIELELSDRLVPLAQEGFDLAIRHAASAPETHVAWTLCRTEAVLVATDAYLRARGTPSTPQDLGSHDCLYYFRRGEAPSWSFETRRGSGRRLNVAVSGPFAANNSEALRGAALDGLGIALLPDFSASADLAAGKLVQVLPQWRAVGSFGDSLFALRPYSPYVPRAVRIFVDFLRDQFRDGFG